MDPPGAKPKLTGGKCSAHARYGGKGAPKVPCPVCWGIYLREKGLNIEEVLAPVVVHLDDPVDVRLFIAGLKSALERSSASGGEYTAFGHDKAGRTFQVAVQLKMRLT